MTDPPTESHANPLRMFWVSLPTEGAKVLAWSQRSTRDTWMTLASDLTNRTIDQTSLDSLLHCSFWTGNRTCIILNPPPTQKRKCFINFALNICYKFWVFELFFYSNILCESWEKNQSLVGFFCLFFVCFSVLLNWMDMFMFMWKLCHNKAGFLAEPSTL